MKQLVFKKNQKINKKMIFVSKENLSHNYRQIDKLSGNSKIISVIKGDGYGHGLLECCKILKSNKCKDFYVARLDDAINLRENFKNINIYLLSGVISNNDLKEIKKNKIIPIINNVDQLSLLKTSQKLKYVLHIDTGMNRLGFQASELEKYSNLIDKKNIIFLMSHLSSADDLKKNESSKQLNKLIDLNKNFNLPLSIANSSGIFLGKQYHLNYVRPGKSLYGINPFYKKRFNLRQVMSIYSPILQIQNVRKGNSIGYSQTYKLKKDLKVATIDFGYSDGFLRSGSNKASVYIDKFQCRILGRVSMDLITIDVSKVPNNKLYLGKPVEIIGSNQRYERIAYETGTNEHEILISLGRNLRKVYI